MVLDLYRRRYPFRAANDGLHEFDGLAGDWDDASLDSYLRQLGEVTCGDTHDQRLAWQTAQAERFWYGELGWHTVNPLVYLEAVDTSLYLKRHYAPVLERADAAFRHVSQVPGVLAAARRNLTGPTSSGMLLQAASGAREYAAFYRDELASLTGTDAVQAGADALDQFAVWLTERAALAPDHYAMGPALFERMLSVTQGFDLSAERLEKLARAELERNLALRRELGEASGGPPPVERIIPEATAIVAGLRDYLHAHALVSMPGETVVEVRPSPAGARWSFASMDNPGPFEASEEAFYYVTLPDPAWPAQEQQDWLASFEPGLLHLITLHESFPGHYVHHLHMREVSSPERKTFRNYAFTEGWAHYCEELMVEVGYHGTVDPQQLAISQVLAALDRCCRLLGSVRLHCAGDSLFEVSRLFSRDAFMEPGRAMASARRGAFDPEYGYYTLGKLMVKKLRRDLDLPLREFHDTLLAWGAPPFALLRRSLGLSEEAL